MVSFKKNKNKSVAKNLALTLVIRKFLVQVKTDPDHNVNMNEGSTTC